MSLISDIAQYIEDGAIGTLDTDLFYSFLPADVTPGILVVDTGGSEPNAYIPTKEPTFQVFIRNTSYDDGKAKLDAIRALLHQVKNTTIGSTYAYFILAMSEGGHLGLDEAGHDLFSINFRCRTQ